MKVTFGIISHKDTGIKLESVISSIIEHGPLDKEIIIVGNNKPFMQPSSYLYYVPFDEECKKAWITKKKNIITRMAKYDNIVYMHDYVQLTPNWESGFDELEPWDVCMSCIINKNESRFRDWVAWDDPDLGPAGGRIKEKWCPNGIYRPGSLHLAPYNYTQTQYMYVSGAYWVAKKEFMLKYPLNEDLSWGEGEDVEWSYRVRQHWQYKMNTKSKVVLNKQK